MSVSPGFRDLVLEQLGRVAPAVTGRAMFGGVGIYSDGRIFALVDDDILYLKADDLTRPDFEAEGMGPFRPFGPDGEVMQYWRLPDGVLEDTELLAPWVEKAVAVAGRARRRRR
ncbi:MAG TPA: TfoX/Sxy family protein [Gemmatimonadales bacterium]|nr:TfoX/Sxy family protein [Gemmatimonadales bacterium]